MIPPWLAGRDEVLHVHHTPTTPGVRADWPTWLPADIVDIAARHGVERPWAHQAQAADALFHGRHVALSTPTASGKTLAYLLPILAATSDEHSIGHPVAASPLLSPRRPHTALYLSPTKALGHDQLRAAKNFAPAGWPAVAIDGDSDEPERRYARESASYLITNPDLLHYTILGQHTRWASFLRGLRYLVIDESHRYRGVFGAHVSAVIRRLRRICRLYGSDPIIICSSATSTDAASAMAALCGLHRDDIVSVDVDTSARPARDVVLWNGAEHSLISDAAQALAQFVDADQQTLAFVSSRHQAERLSTLAAERSRSGREILAYRAGYLARDRRAVEAGLQSRAIMGAAATSALELGVDIAGVDAVIVAGYPGTLASLWQRAGRAGRAGRDALVILMAREDPLDQYLWTHPELIFDAPVERVVIYPNNPQVLGPHLCAAASEAPLTEEDLFFFGPTARTLVEQLVDAGLLRRRPTGWYWPHPAKAAAAIDLRSAGDGPVQIVDGATGQVIGHVDAQAADRTVFPGAVYLHQGTTWLCVGLDPQTKEATVVAETPTYTTQALSTHDVAILHESARRKVGRGIVCKGTVRITGQVRAYLRRDAITGEVWDETPLEMPERTMETDAMWWLIDDDVLRDAGLDGLQIGSAAHAAEHTAIGLLPAFAPCDRWDIGGLSTAHHPDTNVCTIFVHDGQPGGGGFAAAGYDAVDDWWRTTLERLIDCPCDDGCPRCCVSPKCGNANQHLDKHAARALLTTLLDTPSR